VIPTRIGRYEIDGELGRGGLTVVALARDPVLARRVAIKVLRNDLQLDPATQSELAVRFKKEARAVAALSHPNIVTLHDFGDDPEAGPFLVFECIGEPHDPRGVTLRDRLREPLPVSEIIRLSRSIGEGLTAAHEAGIVHRDLKPENVLLGRYGAKIADFGLARPEKSNPENDLAGTPAYSAPEVLAGAPATARSDQFAFAAILHEMISGKRAFGGDDAAVTVRRILSGERQPLERHGFSISALETARGILGKGLASRPEDRFVSARALGDALAATLDGSFERSLTPVPDSLAGLPESLQADLRSSVSPASRFRTRRVQDIAIGAAILVFVALYFFGRKRDDRGGIVETIASDIADRSRTAPPPTKPKQKLP
jgi:serine/threonine-protein kinase